MDIPKYIAQLSDADAQLRLRAARDIFDWGRRLSDPILGKWLVDGELAGLLVRVEGEATATASGPNAAAGDLAPRTPAPWCATTVGIAVQPWTFEKIREANGAPPLAQVPPDQDATEFELEFPGHVRIDVLTTRTSGGGGPIARYLEKFGEGIQQVEFDVRDVDAASAMLRRSFGLEPIYPATRAGANGTRVNFFLLTGSDGRKILIELVGKAR
ncbi:MAG: hypothetical protein WB869_18180 [Candidatus Acidiferrales bacterium]